MIINNLSILKIHKLTKEQYERELNAGNIDENALYLIPDEEIDLSNYATIEELNKIPKIYSGTEEPDNFEGKDGDIYIMYEE